MLFAAIANNANLESRTLCVCVCVCWWIFPVWVLVLFAAIANDANFKPRTIFAHPLERKRKLLSRFGVQFWDWRFKIQVQSLGLGLGFRFGVSNLRFRVCLMLSRSKANHSPESWVRLEKNFHRFWSFGGSKRPYLSGTYYFTSLFFRKLIVQMYCSFCCSMSGPESSGHSHKCFKCRKLYMVRDSKVTPQNTTRHTYIILWVFTQMHQRQKVALNIENCTWFVTLKSRTMSHTSEQDMTWHTHINESWRT